MPASSSSGHSTTTLPAEVEKPDAQVVGWTKPVSLAKSKLPVWKVCMLTDMNRYDTIIK